MKRPLKLLTCRIAAGPRGTRRQRESDAVRHLIDQAFGADAVYSHNADGRPLITPASASIGSNAIYNTCNKTGSCNKQPYISVSHSADYAALLIGDFAEIGVDIEQMRPKQLLRVASRILTADEYQRFTSDEALLWAWTAKEAVYKAAGVKALSGPEIELGEIYGHTATACGKEFRLYYFRAIDYLIVIAALTDDEILLNWCPTD